MQGKGNGTRMVRMLLSVLKSRGWYICKRRERRGGEREGESEEEKSVVMCALDPSFLLCLYMCTCWDSTIVE